jgi:Zn-finger protein
MGHSEIREQLEKITKGEWRYSDDGHYVWETNTGLYVAKSVTKNDGEFFAASPSIIRQLLEEVEKLTAERKRLQSELEVITNETA